MKSVFVANGVDNEIKWFTKCALVFCIFSAGILVGRYSMEGDNGVKHSDPPEAHIVLEQNKIGKTVLQVVENLTGEGSPIKNKPQLTVQERAKNIVNKKMQNPF